MTLSRYFIAHILCRTPEQTTYSAVFPIFSGGTPDPFMKLHWWTGMMPWWCSVWVIKKRIGVQSVLCGPVSLRGCQSGVFIKSGFHLCLIFSVKYNQPTNKVKDGIVSLIIWSSDWFVSFLNQPWFQILLKTFQFQFLWIPTVTKMKIQNQIYFPRHAAIKEVYTNDSTIFTILGNLNKGK